MSGYKIVDLKNTNLVNGTPVKIKGIYEEIESNYRKPIILSNVVIDRVEKIDKWVNFSHSENSYTCIIPEGTISLNNEDNVTFRVKE